MLRKKFLLYVMPGELLLSFKLAPAVAEKFETDKAASY